jgi:hypothetical protein
MSIKWSELRNFKQLDRSRQIQIALELIFILIVFSIIIYGNYTDYKNSHHDYHYSGGLSYEESHDSGSDSGGDRGDSGDGGDGGDGGSYGDFYGSSDYSGSYGDFYDSGSDSGGDWGDSGDGGDGGDGGE